MANRILVRALVCVACAVCLVGVFGAMPAHAALKTADAEMEGIVCRPLFELADRRGNRMIVKIKCRDFPAEDG